jgi:LacI family transcriptional regulator
VPEDVAVCGFDNIAEAEVIVPALTTVDQGAEAMGRRAALLLLERLDGKADGEPRQVSTPCRFVLRSSA